MHCKVLLCLTLTLLVHIATGKYNPQSVASQSSSARLVEPVQQFEQQKVYDVPTEEQSGVVQYQSVTGTTNGAGGATTLVSSNIQQQQQQQQQPSSSVVYHHQQQQPQSQSHHLVTTTSAHQQPQQSTYLTRPVGGSTVTTTTAVKSSPSVGNIKYSTSSSGVGTSAGVGAVVGGGIGSSSGYTTSTHTGPVVVAQQQQQQQHHQQHYQQYQPGATPTINVPVVRTSHTYAYKPVQIQSQDTTASRSQYVIEIPPPNRPTLHIHFKSRSSPLVVTQSYHTSGGVGTGVGNGQSQQHTIESNVGSGSGSGVGVGVGVSGAGAGVRDHASGVQYKNTVEEAPIRLVHRIHKPISLQVHQVVAPYRYQTVQVNPVQEHVHTIVYTKAQPQSQQQTAQQTHPVKGTTTSYSSVNTGNGYGGGASSSGVSVGVGTDVGTGSGVGSGGNTVVQYQQQQPQRLVTYSRKTQPQSSVYHTSSGSGSGAPVVTPTTTQVVKSPAVVPYTHHHQQQSQPLVTVSTNVPAVGGSSGSSVGVQLSSPAQQVHAATSVKTLQQQQQPQVASVTYQTHQPQSRPLVVKAPVVRAKEQSSSSGVVYEEEVESSEGSTSQHVKGYQTGVTGTTGGGGGGSVGVVQQQQPQVVVSSSRSNLVAPARYTVSVGGSQQQSQHQQPHHTAYATSHGTPAAAAVHQVGTVPVQTTVYPTAVQHQQNVVQQQEVSQHEQHQQLQQQQQYHTAPGQVVVATVPRQYNTVLVGGSGSETLPYGARLTPSVYSTQPQQVQQQTTVQQVQPSRSVVVQQPVQPLLVVQQQPQQVHHVQPSPSRAVVAQPVQPLSARYQQQQAPAEVIQQQREEGVQYFGGSGSEQIDQSRARHVTVQTQPTIQQVRQQQVQNVARYVEAPAVVRLEVERSSQPIHVQQQAGAGSGAYSITTGGVGGGGSGRVQMVTSTGAGGGGSVHRQGNVGADGSVELVVSSAAVPQPQPQQQSQIQYTQVSHHPSSTVQSTRTGVPTHSGVVYSSVGYGTTGSQSPSSGVRYANYDRRPEADGRSSGYFAALQEVYRGRALPQHLQQLQPQPQVQSVSSAQASHPVTTIIFDDVLPIIKQAEQTQLVIPSHDQSQQQHTTTSIQQQRPQVYQPHGVSFQVSGGVGGGASVGGSVGVGGGINDVQSRSEVEESSSEEETSVQSNQSSARLQYTTGSGQQPQPQSQYQSSQSSQVTGYQPTVQLHHQQQPQQQRQPSVIFTANNQQNVVNDDQGNPIQQQVLVNQVDEQVASASEVEPSVEKVEVHNEAEEEEEAAAASNKKDW